MSLPARLNPFRSEKIDRLCYTSADFSMNQLASQFEQLRRRGAILGPQGHGKTTLLEQFISHLGSSDLCIWRMELKAGDRQLPPHQWEQIQQRAGENDLIVLDGAEQLSWWRWKQFVKSLQPGQGCLITSHRHGLLPSLWHCSTSPELLRRLVAQLQGPLTSTQHNWLDQLFVQTQGDIRQCFRSLYDACAEERWIPSHSAIATQKSKF